MARKRFERLRAFLDRVELTVDVKDVLPWLAMDGARFDLRKVGADCGEFIQRRDEGAGAVLDREGDADLVGIGHSSGFWSAADEEEPSVVLRIVFDAGAEDLCAVVVSGGFAGNRPGVFVAELNELFDASGRVVEGV